LHSRGDIFQHRHLVFKNGVIGNKYLILLNTPGNNEPYLFVKTTSKQKNKPRVPGCIKELSLFFIPSNKAFFPLDTWVQLWERYPIPANDISNDPDITFEGTLDAKLTEKIINCLFASEDNNIEPVFRRLLRPGIVDSISKLKAKFDRGKPPTRKR
jgi:hypothetical protein